MLITQTLNRQVQYAFNKFRHQTVIIDIIELVNALFWQAPCAQTIGFIALIIGVSGFFQKDDQKLRYYLTVFTLLMAVHFFMLEQWAGAVMALFGSARNYISSHTDNKWVMTSFLIGAWLLAIPNTHLWVHLLPVIGTTFGTWALFREKGIRMRLFMSIGTLCWLSHNFFVGSIGGVLIEGIFLVINSRTMLKLLKDGAVQSAEH